MSLERDYRAATDDAIAFLTALHLRDAESAALVSCETADLGLTLWCMGQLYLGTLCGVAQDHGTTVDDLIRSIARTNVEHPL